MNILHVLQISLISLFSVEFIYLFVLSQRSKKRLNGDYKKRQLVVLMMIGIQASMLAFLIAIKSIERPYFDRNLPDPPPKMRFWLKNEVEKMEVSGKGVLLHNIPKEMTVQNTEIIEVRVAKKLSVELTQQLKGNGDPEISQVKVQSMMGAVLTGTKNYFDIDLKNTEEKTIQAETFGEWIYDVTPEEAGTPDIYLTLYLVLETPEGKYKYEHPPIKKTITVHPNPVAASTSFLTRNWKELVGFVIALGLIGASANWLKQRWEKRTNHQEASSVNDADEEP